MNNDVIDNTTIEVRHKMAEATYKYRDILHQEYSAVCSTPAVNWVTANWEHVLVYNGKEVVDEGLLVYCYGFDSNNQCLPCDTCKSTESAALAARNTAREALGAATRGDWKTAAEKAHEVKKIEDGCHDEPYLDVWREFYLTAQAAYKAVESIRAAK